MLTKKDIKNANKSATNMIVLADSALEAKASPNAIGRTREVAPGVFEAVVIDPHAFRKVRITRSDLSSQFNNVFAEMGEE